tara:strand:+ start:183 stop:1295 length:1113 start_codon:yes stop_codon:yes gene_type:complete
MKYILDISCLDELSSGAKQRFLNLYSLLIKTNNKKKFLIIYTKFTNVKKILNYPNVSFVKNNFNQDTYLKKMISIFFIFFYIKINFKKIKTIEYFTLPFFKIKKPKTIFTIHDIRRIFFAKNLFSKFFFKFFFKFFLNQTTNIIVVSKAIKNEMRRHFHKLKIVVIYNVIDKKIFQNIAKNDTYIIKRKYNLPNKFILTVGHQEKRKNFLRLINAINILKKDGLNIKLIIIGQKADETKKINRLIIKLNLSQNIKIFSNLNDFELRCFYRLAGLFVFPSVYEGFGIPLLEAMASNLPMVLSNTEVFREITQNKYSYFDQYDSLSIASKIKFVLFNKSFQKRMIIYGKKRVTNFSANVQAKEINNLYNNKI